ncbi:hypothetical protein D3870_09595 [Noviherbaspirillum cavernae]|uniref:Uncharacterized protein n=1 Tax=Noviherbaspirillum cavernae TaxID=2320862 RepID=A0A418X1A5_9BURK|nr:hypothetical protein [Noviherbaspirillum cavernae]RJG06231.1 hypothetical protein D3870_09595 [Noviherbaspirillum cavernae]
MRCVAPICAAVVAVLCISGASFAAGEGAQGNVSAHSHTASGAMLAQTFANPVSLRGTLGSEQIQINLRPKVPAEDGIEGDYFVFGKSQRILLAGEVDGNEVLMEESENGTDVSGQWIGTVDAGTFRGDWQSADGSVSKPFALKIVRIDDKSKAGQQQVRGIKPTARTQP